jgi:lipid-binding SYLF domain-containing protein
MPMPTASDYADRLREAAAVQETMLTPDRAISQTPPDRASCIVIVPGVKEGGFSSGRSGSKAGIRASRHRTVFG